VTQALLVRADDDLPLELVDVPTTDERLHMQRMYELLACDFVEVIHPTDHHLFPDGRWIAFGDADGRLRQEIHPNLRATMLFGYPYFLVGDFLIFCDSPNGVSLPVPASLLTYVEELL
jgi:hypothetical protein